jgi:GNAT superfamily N-acetyltransferase
MPIEIHPLREDHVGEGSAMVISGRQAAMDLEPELPANFLDHDEVTERLQGMVQMKRPGVVAIRDDTMVGFLVGFTSQFRGEPTAYSPDWGHAAVAKDRCDIYRSMYANLASQWVSIGYLSHSVSVLSHDKEAIDAWHSMGFGHFLIDAIRDVGPVQGSVPDLSFRRAEAKDIETIMKWDASRQRFLSSSPVFIHFPKADSAEDHERWLSESTNALWIGCTGCRPIGYVRMEPSNTSRVPISDPTTVCISGAFIEAAERGKGVGTALLNRGLEWARSRGYKHCGVDYETANVVGARFWSQKGFRPFCLSLNRRLDPRITSPKW